MNIPTEFEWDHVKAAANLAKHGITFEEVLAVFADENHITVDTARLVDREVRLKAIGAIDGMLFTVVFTMRAVVCRIISGRRSNRGEEKAYGNR